MNQQTLRFERDFDLPPRWDGNVVVWDGWDRLDAHGPVFICPPTPRHCCPACGSLTPSLTNRGRRALSPRTTRQQILDHDAARRRLPESVRSKLHAGRGPLALYGLTAFRCPDCRFDQVLDADRRWWDLDESDYRADGSWER